MQEEVCGDAAGEAIGADADGIDAGGGKAMAYDGTVVEDVDVFEEWVRALEFVGGTQVGGIGKGMR